MPLLFLREPAASASFSLQRPGKGEDTEFYRRGRRVTPSDAEGEFTTEDTEDTERVEYEASR